MTEKARVWYLANKNPIDGSYFAYKEKPFLMAYKTVLESDQAIALIREMREALNSLMDYSNNLQKNHPELMTHGHGYSLLGELAMQVSSDAHYAIDKADKFLSEVDK